MKISKSPLNYFREYAYDACEGLCENNQDDIEVGSLDRSTERFFGIDPDISDAGKPAFSIIFESKAYPDSPHAYPAGASCEALVEKVFDTAYEQYLQFPTLRTRKFLKALRKEMI